MTYIANIPLRTKTGVIEVGAEIDIKNDEDAQTLLAAKAIKKIDAPTIQATAITTPTK